MTPDRDVSTPAAAPSGPLVSRRALTTAVVAAVAVVAVVAVPRMRARAAVERETRELAIPTVSVIAPKAAAASYEIVLPAEVRPYMDAPIYARTSGYLRKWHADIGARVKSGQLLAEIDAPEIDQQLQQARADLGTAEANERLARTTDARYRELLTSGAISTEDADKARGDFEAKRAMAESARSNVKRLENLQAFERIEAPFDGVITARNTDVGSLIDSGSSGTGRELFHIVAASSLRVYTSVPDAQAALVQPGLTAELTLPAFPGRPFPATLVRTAGAIDRTSRTLLVELSVPNPTGELLAGSFGSVHIKLPSRSDSFLLPVSAIIFRAEGVRMATVKDGRATFVPVVLGRDLGTDVEVLSGLTASDTVVVNPPDSLVSGSEVRVATATEATH
jgi:RND family efflux transporter MFP subunit